MAAGTTVWTTDANLGLCQLQLGGGGAIGTLGACVRPPTTDLTGTIKAVLGQPSFDPVTGFAYVADMSSASKGVWRIHFTGNSFDPGTFFNLAPAAGLGGQRPGATAVGPDGNVYVSMTANGNIKRINTPAAATQTVDAMGSTLDGTPANGLAFVGVQLWVAEGGKVGQVVIFPSATICGTKCTSAANTQITGGSGVSASASTPLSIAYDAPRSFVYIGTANALIQYNTTTGLGNLYSTTYTNAGVPGLYTQISAVGVDSLGNAFAMDDPTAGQGTGVARCGGGACGGATIYEVPVGSLPDGQGTISQPPPTVAPTLLLGTATVPATQYAGGMNTPNGALWMGAHMWVNDSVLGFCKVDPTLPPPSLTACAVLPVGMIPGNPAFDKAGNRVYIPDMTKVPAGAGTTGNGIVRLAFNPLTETVGPAVQVVSGSVLSTVTGGAAFPTACTLGPDGSLYVGMFGSTLIVRVTAPATLTHTTTFIGNMNASPVALAFYKGDLYDAEKTNVSIMRGATLCKGTCTAFFLPVIMRLPVSVISDGLSVYIGDSHLLGDFPGDHLFKYDPVANTFQTWADSGVAGGVTTVFSTVGGLAIDPLGHIYAADAGAAATGTGHVWLIGAAGTLPQLNTVSPNFGIPGASVPVQINGNLLTGATLNMPAGISATGVTVVNSTQINATFNIGAGTPVSTQTFTVTTAAGKSNPLSFLVNPPPPVLNTITPAIGVQGTSVVVLLTGTNLVGATTTTLNVPVGVTVTGLTATATSITATLNISLTAPVGPQNISATTSGGTSGNLIFTINPPVPVLTSIAPLSGILGQTIPVTIVGTNLTGSTLNFAVGGGLSLVTLPVITPTQITATFAIAATAPLGPQNITVTTAGGTSNALAFTVNPLPPTITSMTPLSGAQGLSFPVSITGTNLSGASLTGLLGIGITATNVVSTATTVTATFSISLTAPLGPQGVFVTTSGGTSAPVTFTILPPGPVLTSITPASGVQLTSVPVVIAGTNLLGSTLSLPAGITVDPTVAPVITATSITATLAIATTAPLGPNNITVTTLGGTSNALVFTVIPPPPVLTSVTPAAGGQTTTVFGATFAGTFLTGGTLNLPTGITASNIVITDTQITADLAIDVTALLGPNNITVTTAGGTTAAVVFTVNPAPPLVLTSIAPASGHQAFSVPVVITGTNLLGATLITPVGITATGVTTTATTINATLVLDPAATLGPNQITASIPAGTSNYVLFTVLPTPPVLTSITPAFGDAGASVPVVIAGTFLTGATLNLPAGYTATGTVVTATSISTTLTIAATTIPGPVNITVTTPGGISNAVVFNGLPPVPVLTSIAPLAGVTGTSASVTITGTNLAGATLNLPVGITATGLINTGTQIAGTFTIATTVPLGPASISVTTPSGTSNALTYTILPPPPTLTSITPGSAFQGTIVPVSIVGTNFVPGATTLNVPAGITAATVTVLNSTTISANLAIAANAPTGLLPITVTTAGGTTNAFGFTVQIPIPTLTSVTPAQGGQTVVVPVTIIGTNLLGATINPGPGITVVNLAVLSATQINASFVIAANAPLGVQTFKVTTPGGVSNGLTFTVLVPPPTINQLNSPYSRGANNQGVTVSGVNFDGAIDITHVKILLNGASIPIVSSTVPVANSIIVVPGSFQFSTTQLRWNQTIPTTLPASSATNVYTMVITTPSGSSPAFGFTVQ